MRQEAPAVHSDAHGGFWSIVRYDDIKRAARDFRVFSSALGTSIGARGANTSAPPKAPIEYDPPEHTRLRKAMQTPFLPNNVKILPKEFDQASASFWTVLLQRGASTL